MPKLSERYRGPADLPQRIPVFPLRGAILLPRATLPLNVFEPRYLQMVDDVMSTSRVLGMVQPAAATRTSRRPGSTVPLRRIGCAGRVTAYQELDDGRLLITLTGIARFALVDEVPLAKPYRICTVGYERVPRRFRCRRGRGRRRPAGPAQGAQDLSRGARPARPTGRRSPSPPTRRWSTRWRIVSPYGPEEKQALLEAADLKARAEMLVALAEMELAAGAGGSGSTLQ